MGERIHATYWLETGDDPARAAEVIAGDVGFFDSRGAGYRGRQRGRARNGEQ